MMHTESLHSGIFVAPELAQLLVVEADRESLSYLVDYLGFAYASRSSLYLVRGDKSRSLNRLFDQWAAALQFPFYFGENWGAFMDCLRDLPRDGQGHHVVLIANASQLLDDDPSCLPDFFEIIASIPAEWKQLHPHLDDPQLKLVLHETPQEISRLKARLQDLGRNFDEVAGDWLDLIAEHQRAT